MDWFQMKQMNTFHKRKTVYEKTLYQLLIASASAFMENSLFGIKIGPRPPDISGFYVGFLGKG